MAAAICVTACSDLEPVRAAPSTHSFIQERFSPYLPRQVDMLVVLDNSDSMKEEYELLLQHMEEFIRDLLDPIPPEPPYTDEERARYHAPVEDLHLGVISTDLGTAGYDVEGCSDTEDGDDGMMLLDPDPALALAQCDPSFTGIGAFSETEFFDGTCRSPEDRSGILEDRADRMFSDFQCVTSPGNRGCGFEQPLEAALKALTIHAEPGGPNQGFLRDDSLLYILFITDEDDCSVDLSDPDNEPIFDLSEYPGETPDMRCHQYQDALYPIDRYVEAFSNLKDDPYHLLIGLLIGVPAPSLCNGVPDLWNECLEHEDMRIEPEPTDPGRLRRSCANQRTGASATPPRRLVEFAGKMYRELGGDNVIIQSICTEDFRPVLWPLTSKLRETLVRRGYRQLEMIKDPSDPRGCTCQASCRVMEVMPDDGPCPVIEPPYFTWDRNGDGITDEKDAFMIDEDGKRYTTCEVPQIPALISGCACCLSEDEPDCTCDLKCDEKDAWLVRTSSETGWWHLPYFNCHDQEYYNPEPITALSPTISSRRPHLEMLCSDRVCPPLRACGPTSSRRSWCCDENEYCWEGKCMIRPDICAEYGNDLWCPDPDLPHGGLCCLDHNFDGTLEVQDSDGDGLWDRSAFYCDGRQCVPRP